MTTRQVKAWLRPVTWLVLGALALVALVAFVATHRGVADQEQRLLSERADEVEAIIGNSLTSIDSSLQLLGTLGASSTPQARALFKESAGPLVAEGSTTFGVAVATDNELSVVAAVGEGPRVGDVLTGARAELADRATALDPSQMVSDVITDEGVTRLVLARSVDDGRGVAYRESVLAPGPTPVTAESPFREVRVAVYAVPEVDVTKLVVTTEADIPLSGNVVRQTFDVGADTWLLAVGDRGPIAGALAHNIPWFLLVGGLLVAVLVAAVVETLARRRGYAQSMVTKRTSELEETLRELDETKTFLEYLVTAGPVTVGRISVADQRLTYVSPNLERLHGFTEEEVLTPGFLASRMHPDDLPLLSAAMERMVDGGSEREDLEFRLRYADGEYRWVSTTQIPVRDGDGNVVATLAYGIDVDDQRRAGEAVREAQVAAEAANRAKSEFLSRMSHELRTPLNAVLGFGQILESDPLTEPQREAVDHILKGGRHLLDLINEVLDISRIETGDLALSPEPVLLVELIQDVVALMQPLAEQRSIQMAVDRPGEFEGYVFADRQRAKQVLLNLLSNAVKYNRPHGTVSVSCERADETRFLIHVTDTGMGIPEEQQGLLFRPFERLGAENGAEEGTGIGLALSKRLTEAMGGRLSVLSKPGEGSTFTVELLRVEGQVERYERLTPDPDIAVEHIGDVRVVLHIEDNLSNLTLIQRVLAERPGVEVIGAMQGRLGLELAREHRPVLILLDLHLPDLDGEEVLQRLRGDPVTASIPVVIVSADATPRQVGKLLSAGASGYVTKPIDAREVLRHLDEAGGAN